MGLTALALSTLALGAATVATVTTAAARAADCPVCDMAIVSAEKATMKIGAKTIEYRCVLCAISEAKGEYPNSDVTIAAPSEKSGRKVTLKRVGGKWFASPPSAVFLKAPVKHRQCPTAYHAFSSKAALAAWAKKYGYPNQPLTLAQMIAVSK
jgi:hypothetical protein